MESSRRKTAESGGGCARAVRVLAAALTITIAVIPVRAQVLGACVGAFGGGSCTANDVRITGIAVVKILDGCVNTADEATFDITASVESGMPDRYDIGLWIATEGVSALTGTECLHDWLPVTDPTVYEDRELDTTNNLDVCGDVGDSQIYLRGISNVTVSCDDIDPTNGLLEFATCTSWRQTADELDCSAVTDTVPGTSSKCNCDDGVPSGVSVPELSLTKSCAPDPIVPGGTISCVVTVTNSGVGAADRTVFEDDYPQTYGTPSSITTSQGSAIDDGDIIAFDPGVIAGGTSVTLSYDFDVFDASSLPNGWNTDTFTNTVKTFYINDDLVPIEQTLTASETTTVPVELRSFRADPDRVTGETLFTWSTATEVANLGFNLYAVAGRALLRLNDSLIPSSVIDSTETAHYRFTAYGSGARKFVIEDVDTRGRTTRHGPFLAARTYGTEAGQVDAIDWPAIGRKHKAKRSKREDGKRERLRQAVSNQLAGKQGKSARYGGRPAAELKIIVRQDGVYRLSDAQLRDAGFDVRGVKADRLALTLDGEPAPIFVGGLRKNGRFGRASFVEFIGESRDTLYTDANVYVMSLNAGLARRVARSSARVSDGAEPEPFYMHTVTHENRRVYSPAAPRGDPWLDRYLQAVAGPVAHVAEVQVDQLDRRADQPVTVSVDLWGVTDFPVKPDHHVLVGVNGATLADDEFEGSIAHSVVHTVSTDRIEEGTNEIWIELPHDTGALADVVALDRYAFTYPRRFVAVDDRLTFRSAGQSFRVSSFSTPDIVVYREADDGAVTRLEGLSDGSGGGGYAVRFAGAASRSTYHVFGADALQTPELELADTPGKLTDHAAEYLVIAHPDFIGPALDRLVAARRRTELSAAVVDVEDVYGAYGHFIVDAQAIHDFIMDAVASGTRYVLLVGGDSYDYRDYLHSGSISFVPSLYRQTGALVRYAPVDALYGDVDGDELPDIPVGRLPVRTVDELDVLVEKILAYEAQDNGRTVVLAADKYDESSSYSFAGDSERLASAFLDAGWDLARAYIDGPFGIGVEPARDLLVDAINHGIASKSLDGTTVHSGGVGLVMYSGHSGPNVWTFDGLFSSRDALELTNREHPTAVIQLGCWNTYYVAPTEDTLAHSFMLNREGGAAAVLGSSTLTDADAERRFAMLLQRELLDSPGAVGDAVVNAKRRLAALHPDQLDVILGYTLLGDPAARIAAPARR